MKRGTVAGLAMVVVTAAFPAASTAAKEAVVVGQRQWQRGFNNDFALN